MNRRRRPAPALVTAVLIAIVGLLAGCGGGDDPPPGGAASAREVVDLHLAASRRYDLAATCQLFTPAKRTEMAAFDRTDVEGYCERATRPVVEAADAATKERARRIYSAPVVTPMDRPGGTWFAVEAADGSYREEIETVEVDGRWWVGQVESDIDVHQHQDGEEPHQGE